MKKSASGVLAALRGSTYQGVRLASSLAAALLDGPFELSVGNPRNVHEGMLSRLSSVLKEFFNDY